MVKRVGNPTGRKTKRAKAIEAKKLDLAVIKPEKPQAPQTETKVRILKEKTVERKVWDMLQKGFSESEISERLDVDTSAIAKIIANDMKRFDEEAEFFRNKWKDMTLARSEFLMKRLLDQVDERDYIDRDDVIMFRELVELQSSVQGFDQAGAAPIYQQGNIVNQIDTGSPVYRKEAAKMQIEATGETTADLAEYAPKPSPLYDELDNIEFD